MPRSLQQRIELGLLKHPTYRDLWDFEKYNIEENGQYVFDDYIQQFWEAPKIKADFSKLSSLMETE